MLNAALLSLVSSLSRALKRSFDSPRVWADRIQSTLHIPVSQLSDIKDKKHWYVKMHLKHPIHRFPASQNVTFAFFRHSPRLQRQNSPIPDTNFSYYPVAISPIVFRNSSSPRVTTLILTCCVLNCTFINYLGWFVTISSCINRSCRSKHKKVPLPDVYCPPSTCYQDDERAGSVRNPIPNSNRGLRAMYHRKGLFAFPTFGLCFLVRP